MQKRLVLDHQQIDIILRRFCYQLIETHDDFDNTVFLGLQPRGTLLLDKIVALLEQISVKKFLLDTWMPPFIGTISEEGIFPSKQTKPK